MSNHDKNNWTLARVMTRSAWLHVQDALEIGKFRLFLGNYQRGQGAKAKAAAYVDVDALRVVFQDLALRAALPKNLYPKQSVEFFGGSERDGRLEARIVKISEQSAMKNPIIIEISHGPGKRNRTGGIQPLGKLETVSVLLDRWSARRLAAKVLAELAAWESATVMSRRRGSNERDQGASDRPEDGFQQGYNNDVRIDDDYESQGSDKSNHQYEPEPPEREDASRNRRNERREPERREPDRRGKERGEEPRSRERDYEREDRSNRRERPSDRYSRSNDRPTPAKASRDDRPAEDARDRRSSRSDRYEDEPDQRPKKNEQRHDEDIDEREANRRARRRKVLDKEDDRSRGRRRSYRNNEEDDVQSKSFHKTAKTLKALRSKR